MLYGFRLHIKFTKACPSLDLMNKTADSKTNFKFLDVYLLVRRVHTNPAILSAHITTLNKVFLARNDVTSVELNTFTFFTGSKFLSIDDTVLDPSETAAINND